MAYDEVRGEVVLFGGSAGGLQDDTWLWDGGQWTMAAASGPPARQLHGMAFDPIRQEVVLVGGLLADGAASRETWAWDGSQWSLRASSGFGTCYGFAVCFDASLGGVLLVGGIQPDGRVLDQAAVWDGATWGDVSDFPDQRFAQGMAFFEDRDESLLFGGSGDLYVHDVQTWAYRDSTWEVRANTGPVHRTEPAMSYYGEAGGVVMFGGRDQFQNRLDDTWIWDGAWTQGASSPGGGRTSTAMAYDRERRQLVLFGGSTDNGRVGDTWVFFCATCDVDLTGDGVVDTLDFLLFLGAWAQRDPLADWNGDGTINTLDFLAYLNDWSAGC